MPPGQSRHRWRDYRTRSGRRPVRDFIDGLSDVDATAVVAAMKDVQVHGVRVARHLAGDIYEVRAVGDRQTFRVLFSREGRRGQALLALHAFSKKSRATPPQAIRLAQIRLAAWREQGES